MPFSEKVKDVIALNFVVIIVDVGVELHFLELDVNLLLFGVPLLAAFLIPEFAKIEDAADRRGGLAGHLHQVQVGGAGAGDRVIKGDDAQLLLVLVDQANLLAQQVAVVGADEASDGEFLLAWGTPFPAGFRMEAGTAGLAFFLYLLTNPFHHGVHGAGAEFTLSPVTDGHLAGGHFTSTHHQHVRQAILAGPADLGTNGFRFKVYHSPDAGLPQSRDNIAGIVQEIITNRQDAGLLGRQPGREGPGVVFDEDAEKPFQRTEQGAMHHVWAVPLAVGTDIGHVEAFG